MKLVISDAVRIKLKDKHHVTEEEIVECFAQRERTMLLDNRADHATNPPTQWFIAETFMNRPLKVVFIFKDGFVYIRSAYPPNPDEIRIYSKHSKPL